MRYRFWYVLLLLALTHWTATATPGQWQWAISLNATPAAVTTDAAGNSYVAGTFRGQAQFGTTILTSYAQSANEGDTDGFIAKFSPSGALTWVTHLGGEQSAVTISALALDAAGNCSFTGSVRGPIRYGQQPTQTLDAVLEWPGVLVGRCGAAGTVNWVRRDGSYFYASRSGAAIAADAAGNCYVTGAITTPLGPEVPEPSGLRYQFYVASYSATGAVRWAQIGQNSSLFNNGQAVVLDGTGNCYVSGYYTRSLDLAGTTLTASNPVMPMGFVGRFRQQDGAMAWVHNLDGVGPYTKLAPANNGFYLAGQFSGSTFLFGQALISSGGEDAYLAQFAADGKLRWAQALPGTTDDEQLVALLSDGPGNNYVLLNQLVAEGGNLTLLHLSPDGHPSSTTHVAGTPAVRGVGLGLDGSKQVTVAGVFDRAASFGPYPLRGGDGTGFVARLSCRGNEVLATSSAVKTAAEVAMFPNPVVGGRCTVRLPAVSLERPARLQLIDQYGRVVHTQTATDAETLLDARALPMGPYTLRITTATAAFSKTLIVQH